MVPSVGQRLLLDGNFPQPTLCDGGAPSQRGEVAGPFRLCTQDLVSGRARLNQSVILARSQHNGLGKDFARSFFPHLRVAGTASTLGLSNAERGSHAGGPGQRVMHEMDQRVAAVRRPALSPFGTAKIRGNQVK